MLQLFQSSTIYAYIVVLILLVAFAQWLIVKALSAVSEYISIRTNVPSCAFLVYFVQLIGLNVAFRSFLHNLATKIEVIPV